ncbi:MAG: hypothetical protein C0625_10485 [Arcobacter sp.]|nr:MAG: hypothetical protein C0625_10485 [Arcobacter sp.]
MNRIDEILNRIYDLMGFEKDLEFCEKYNVKPNTLSTWKKRNKIPYELIEKISQIENISLDKILLNSQLPIKKQDNAYQIDLLNVRAGAGEGVYNYLIETVDTITLDKSFFKTAINTDKVKGIQVDGDSMEPTLRDRDFVLIDENITFGTNGIYAIQYGGQILIKRLQFKMDGTILIISDNEKYESETYDPKENQLPFQIIGLKILSIQR